MTNLKLFLIFLLSGLLNLSIYAQVGESTGLLENNYTKAQGPEEGEVVIFQDMRINDLLYNHIEQNKRSGGIDGFRIRIYSNLGSGAREESQAIKARFYELFPEIEIHREYDSPYFKVYVGDYRTKVDALKDFNQIKRYFRSAFIVPDKINYPEFEE